VYAGVVIFLSVVDLGLFLWEPVENEGYKMRRYLNEQQKAKKIIQFCRSGISSGATFVRGKVSPVFSPWVINCFAQCLMVVIALLHAFETSFTKFSKHQIFFKNRIKKKRWLRCCS